LIPYRPQYAFGTPPGFRDEQFHYSFDATNVPVLGTAIGAGLTVRNIVLQLQNDAEFILRAWKIQVSPPGRSSLALTIRDPYGNYLSASHLMLNNYLTPGGAVGIGQMVVPCEAEIRAPIGGFFDLTLYNPTLGNVTPGAFTLYGLNRREALGRAA